MPEGSATADKSKPYVGHNSLAEDRGYTKDGDATATCLCGEVQLAFVSTYLANCLLSSIKRFSNITISLPRGQVSSIDSSATAQTVES